MAFRKDALQSGFTLIQLSIMLTMAALVMVAILPGYQTSTKANSTSVIKMNAIMMALRQYQLANSTLPCPADPTIATGNSNYGVASANGGTTSNCVTGTAPNAAYADSTNHIAMGMVPVTTLGLSNDYALDGFGRYITYAVDTNATTPCWQYSALPGAITVNNNGINQSTVAVLVSHGTDGYGAWLPVKGTGGSGTGKRFNSGSTDTSQAANAQVTAGTTTANTTFVPFVNKSQTSTFDDLVVYNNQQYNMNSLPQTYTQTTSYLNNCGPYYATITINHAQVNTAVSYFPMLVSSTYSYLESSANGGYVLNTNGYDIYFADALGNSLPFELRSYNPATGQVVAWVQVGGVAGALSTSTNTTIYMVFHNANITTNQSSSSTWDSNYKGVFHLDGTSTDSTSNGNTLTNVGSVSNSSGLAAPGQATKAMYFNGTTGSGSVSLQYLYAAAPVMTVTDNYTLSAWVNPAATSSDTSVIANGTFQTNGYWFDMITNKWKGVYTSSGPTTNTDDSKAPNVSITSMSASNWEYIVWTAQSSNTTDTSYIYCPTSLTGSTCTGSTSYTKTFTDTPALTPTGGFGIGSINYGSNYQKPFNGTIAEVRLSSTPRSAGWIQTEFNNQGWPDAASTASVSGISNGFYSVTSSATKGLPPYSSR